VGGTTFDSAEAVTLYVRPEFPDQVWVGTKGALFVSVDRGGSWTQIWNNDGAVSRFSKKPAEVEAIVRRKDGIAYVATNVGGYRVTATDWNKPDTYTLTKTVSWWDGWGPVNATLLADDSFITGGIHGDRDPKNPSNLQGAQRVSTDGGLTWTYLPMNLSMPPRPVWSSGPKPDEKTHYGRDFIVQDPKDHKRLYVTGGYLPAISEDLGQNWKFVPNNSGLAGIMTYKVNFTRKNPNAVLVPGSDLAVFVITDGGASGAASESSNRTVDKLITVHEVMSSDDGAILVGAGAEQGASKSIIIRSIDSGATWAELDLTKSGLPASTEGITRSAMNPGNPDDFLVILGANGYSSTPVVWRTLDGGKTFNPIKPEHGLPTNIDTGSRYHPEHSTLLVDGINSSVRYYSARKKVYRSGDHGATWSLINHPWESGAQTPWVHCMAVDRATEGKLWATAAYAGLKTSNDGGGTWSEITGFNDATYVDAANGQVAVFGRREGDEWKKIYFSPDNGSTWTEATGKGHRYAFTKGISVDPWEKGKIWVSGISVNVITGLSAQAPSPTASR
jgi:hypothetical protein